jgi:GAF domain-containing protein
VSDRESWLARTLVELADIRVNDSGEAEYALRLVARLEELLRPDEVGLMLSADGDLKAAAASSTRVRILSAFEERHGTGPCTRCHRSGQATLNRFLKGPGYAEVARKAGFERVSAMPLRRNSEIAGAIAVLHRGPGRLEPGTAALAQALAEAATIAISRRRELRRAVIKAEQLQRALDSRVLIEQAKGAVAARLDLTPSAAFELLRAHARRHNLKLADVAAAAIAGNLTADLRARS